MPNDPASELDRFLTLDKVADESATSHAQAHALVRRGEPRSMKLGGRGQWRMRRPDVEEYIALVRGGRAVRGGKSVRGVEGAVRMSVAGVLDRLQRRRPWAGFPIAVIYKYIDDSGGYLAALITYYAFVSLFPLLLLFATVLGFVLAGDLSLQHRIETSTLSQFPVVGPELGRPKAIGGGVAGLVIGVLGALYGGLGVAQAAQYAMNTAWAVPRNARPDPFKSRGRGLLLLLTVGVAAFFTTALSAVSVSSASALGVLARVAVVAVSTVLNGMIFLVAFRFSTGRVLTFRQLWPGALCAAVAWELLQTFGVKYVGHVVKNASATNSVFAVVLGLLAFLYLTSVAVVICVEINVVRVNHLYPRALLTPFTDNVTLTSGDKRAYTEQTEAQRAKGFQNIDVTFERPDDDSPSDS